MVLGVPDAEEDRGSNPLAPTKTPSRRRFSRCSCLFPCTEEDAHAHPNEASPLLSRPVEMVRDDTKMRPCGRKVDEKLASRPTAE